MAKKKKKKTVEDKMTRAIYAKNCRVLFKRKVQLHSVAIGVHPRKKLYSSMIEIAILL